MGVYFGYYFTLNVFLELHTHPQMLRICYLHDMTVFSSTPPSVGLKNKAGEARKEREEAGHFIIFKTEFLSRCVCVSYLRPGSSPCRRLREKQQLGRSGSEVMLFNRTIPGILGATEYLKGLGFHEENTKKE